MKNRIFKIVLLLCIPFLGNVNALSNPHGGPIPIRILIQEDSRNLWMWGLGFFGLCCVGRFAVKKYPQVQERFKKFPALKNISDYLVNSYLKRNGQVAMEKTELVALIQEAKTVVAAAQQAVDEAKELKEQNTQLQTLLQEKQAEAQVARAPESSQPKSLWGRFFGRDSSAQQSSSPVQNNPFSGIESALERSRKHRQENQQTKAAFGQRGGAQIVELPDNKSDGDAHPRLAITACVSSVALPLTASSATSSTETVQTAPRLFGQTGINIAFNHQQIPKKRTPLGSFSRPLLKQIAGSKPGCLVGLPS